jgi:hypothetical protein
MRRRFVPKRTKRLSSICWFVFSAACNRIFIQILELG